MRCKIFSVPLTSETGVEREQKLNEFLDATTVKRVFASIANQPEGPMWSILFFYEGEAPATQPTYATQPARPTQVTQAMPVTQKAPLSPGAAGESGPPLTGDQVKFYVALKKWRADVAAQEGVPLYMVSHNKWLEDIVRMPARSMGDLTRVKGFSEWRVQKYGARIVEIMNSASSAKPSWPTSSYSAGRA